MPYSIPNTASTDSYQTFGNGIYTGGWLQVFDQTGVTGGGGVIAYVSHRPAGASGPTSDAEAVQLTPGWYPLIGTPRDPIVSVTFKSAITGKPAQVTGLLVEDGAAGFGSGTQISGSLSSTGTTTPVSGGGSMVSGAITAYGGAIAPTGYVLCDGSLYNGTSTTYSALWAIIGTTYGGTGQTSFAVPDLRGRMIVAQGTNASVSALGTNDGVAVANRRPQHRHTPHKHPIPFVNASGIDSSYSQNFALSNGVNTTDTTSVDGGSGVASDSLNSPAFLVVTYIIAL